MPEAPNVHPAPAAAPRGRAALRRRISNLLPDPGLQLRLGGWLVGIGALLSVTLGVQIWRSYAEASRLVMLGDPRADAAMAAMLAGVDRGRILRLSALLVLVLVLLLALAVLVTHRIAGPAAALGHTCREIAEGRLSPPHPLRKNDFLGGLARDVSGMVVALRAREADEVARLQHVGELMIESPGRARAILDELASTKLRRLGS